MRADVLAGIIMMAANQWGKANRRETSPVNGGWKWKRASIHGTVILNNSKHYNWGSSTRVFHPRDAAGDTALAEDLVIVSRRERETDWKAGKYSGSPSGSSTCAVTEWRPVMF